MPPAPLKKLNGIKMPNLLQTGKEMPYMQIEKVIGLSSRNNNSMAVNPINGDVAYPAGCIICIYSPKENKQTRFLFSRSQRSFSCISYSHTGRYFAAGEGAFRQPEITIWEISLDGQYNEVKHLRGHKYGIESIMFSPNLQYLISLGDANDRGLFVWDWENEQRVTSNKLGKPVNTFAFSETGEYFVTAGYQHLKYWYFDESGRVQKTETNSKESIMESKSADLTKVKLKVFVGVACRQSQVFALAMDGHLYVYDKNRKLTKWMNIKVEKAMSCTMTNDYLFCGCSDGIVRVFGTKSLEHIVTLPKPPPLGSANIESGDKKIRIPCTKESKFADTLAVIVDETNSRVVVLYSDRMIFIWDIKQFEKIPVYRTSFSHSGPIHDIQFIPNSMEVGFQDESSAVNLQDEGSLTKFMTCSSDRTIRFWHFIDPTVNSQTQSLINKNLVKNAYCKDMSRMIYVNSENRDQNVGQFDHFKMRPVKLNEDGSLPDQATLSPDDKEIEQQLRCVRISPDGRHVACGDWTGNIRVHDLKKFEEIQCIQAHESEVVCLDYSPLIELPGANNSTSGQNNYDALQNTSQSSKYWLASGSRDRLTQIFEVTSDYRSYENVTILEDHSSTLTSIKFAEERSIKGQKRLKLISCGADKQIILRNVDMPVVEQNDVRKLQEKKTEDFIVVQKKEQCKYKTFSMEIAQQGGYIITGHDKFLQLWQLSTCDKVWEKKPETQRKSGTMDHIKVTVDSNAGVVISSCTDKFVTIYEAFTGNVVCKTTCGEITTGLCLSSNLKHLITTSADGIIYIWRLPEQLSKALQKLKQEQRQKEEELPQPNDDISDILLKQHEFGNFNSNEDEFNELENLADLPAGNGSNQKKKEDDDGPVRISEIMKQINKATGQIEKIKPRGGLQNKIDEIPSDDEEFDFGGQSSYQAISSNNVQNNTQELKNQENNLGESLVSNGSSGTGTNAGQKRNRNNWQRPNNKDPFQQFDSAPLLGTQNKALTEEELQQQQHDETIRQLKVKENKLPRWAQSVTGDQITESGEKLQNFMIKLITNKAQDESKYADTLSNNQPQSIKENKDDDIEDIFQNTLAKLESEKQQENQQKQNSQPHEELNRGVSKNTFYDKIDEDIDEDKKSNEDQEEEDEEEKYIKEQIRRRQMYRSRILLGIDDNSDDDNNNGSNSKNNNKEGTIAVTESQVDLQAKRLRMRQNENRTSLSQQFFQRKISGASSEQNLFRGQASSQLQLIQNQYKDLKQQNDNANKTLKVEDLFDEVSDRKSGIKGLQESKSQLINQTPQQLIRPQTLNTNTQQDKKTYTILSKAKKQESQNSQQDVVQQQQQQKQQQPLLQQQDIKKIAEEKYDNHKKQIEEEFQRKQIALQEKNNQDKKDINKQQDQGKIQIENQQKDKQSENPQILIQKPNENQMKNEEEKNGFVDYTNQRNKDYLIINDKSKNRNASRSNSRQRYLEEDESVVQINSAPQGSNQIDEAAINATIKAEMDKINNSLAKITQSLNSIGIKGGFKDQSIRVKEDVTESLSRSIGLWNSMMMTLGNRTSINMNLLQSQQISSINMSSSQSVSNSSMNQSYLSQISVKDDARDLLQKYSDLLVEEIAKKLNSKR